MNAFALWLLAARNDKKMTQQALGELLGCSPQYISGLHSGRVGVTLPQVIKIARVLNQPEHIAAKYWCQYQLNRVGIKHTIVLVE